MKIIFIHGNGGSTADDYWLPAVADQFREAHFDVVNETFPDNQLAHSTVWLPYIKKLGVDEHSILIGHSSGAVAAMRYAEKHKILGSVLVAPTYTDLGDEAEKASGYFEEPWNWRSIKNNQKWIIQFASADDPYIPANEPLTIRHELDSSYIEFVNRGHFMDQTNFPELIEAVMSKLRQ